ncbi:MAG TPA: pentapeptide repeat-containing protein [Nitrospira sp.]
MRNSLRRWFFFCAVMYCAIPSDGATGDCRIDRTTQEATVFKVHVSDGCPGYERESQAVWAKHILAAIKQGKSIDLSGVVIQGDLSFDDLPIGMLPKEMATEALESRANVRIVPGSFSIVNSVVRGAIQHKSTQDLLVMNGPVTVSNTRFEQPVDLSRALFVQAVVLSAAVFLKESYFVQGRFLRDLFAENVKFGPHTRFHRAHFRGPVTFRQSVFGGLAEFLEVEFERDADFSGTYFKAGTGFSGGHFGGAVDFSDARFEREAFFTFTQFDGDAVFLRATFGSMADFDDAQFTARDDFSKVLFKGDSRFARVKRPRNGTAAPGIENPQVQYVITLSLLVFSVLLIAYLIRSR